MISRIIKVSAIVICRGLLPRPWLFWMWQKPHQLLFIIVVGMNMLRLFLADKRRSNKIYWAKANEITKSSRNLCKLSQSGKKVRSPWDSTEKKHWQTTTQVSMVTTFIVEPLFPLHNVVLNCFNLRWLETVSSTFQD